MALGVLMDGLRSSTQRPGRLFNTTAIPTASELRHRWNPRNERLAVLGGEQPTATYGSKLNRISPKHCVTIMQRVLPALLLV